MPDVFHSASESLERSRSAIVAAFPLSAIAASRAGPVEAADLVPFSHSLVGAEPALFAENIRSCSDQSSHISANWRQVRCASRSEAYCAAAKHSSARFLQSSEFIVGSHYAILQGYIVHSYFHSSTFCIECHARTRLGRISTLNFGP